MSSRRTNSIITTGGGFSNYYTMPSYQAAAVAAYLASGAVTPGTGNFARTGRGYPDVAAIGHHIDIWKGGAFSSYVDGTSASAPIFAAILALANNALYLAGKPPVGFVNPSLYTIGAATPAAFVDVNCPGCVNSCSNAGWCVLLALLPLCSTLFGCLIANLLCSPTGCTGFGTSTGWDATTGWGTPQVPALISALVTLGGGVSVSRCTDPSWAVMHLDPLRFICRLPL